MYVLHPGRVTSKNDGDVHFISADNIAKLYRLPHGSWRAAAYHSDLERCLVRGDDINLFPRFDGEYERIAEELEDRRTQPTTEKRG